MIIDLSFVINSGMNVFPNDPEIQFEPFSLIANKGLNLTKIELGTHSGTHIDAPSHFLLNGETIDKIKLERCWGKSIVIDLSNNLRERYITKDILSSYQKELLDLQGVLFKTGWDKKWGSGKYFENYPVLSEEAAHYLLNFKLNFIGIDSPSIGSPDTHKILLSKGILIIETLNLSKLNISKLLFFALPLPFKSLDGSPVRAIAMDIKSFNTKT